MGVQTSMLGRGSVLVTGGTGFLGAHLARALVGLGAEVVITRHAPTPERLGFKLDRIGARQVEIDLRDRAGVRRLFQAVRPVLVWHLAADTRVDRRLELLVPQLEANVLAGGVVLEAALESGVARLVWVGTCEEYGDGPVPFREDQEARPVSPYSISKLAGTLMALSLARIQGAPIVAVRPFLTYGPEQPLVRFIPQTIVAALSRRRFPMTAGEQTRDLLYITDTVAGLLAAGLVPGIEGELINLASGIEHPLAAVAESIYRLAGADPGLLELGALPYRAGESMRFVGDPGKAEALLGWKARIPLEQGLTETVAWYRDAGVDLS